MDNCLIMYCLIMWSKVLQLLAATVQRLHLWGGQVKLNEHWNFLKLYSDCVVFLLSPHSVHDPQETSRLLALEALSLKDAQILLLLVGRSTICLARKCSIIVIMAPPTQLVNEECTSMEIVLCTIMQSCEQQSEYT